MLPKIKDAGQRAGLVKHFAPKIEDAMAQVEKEIQDKKLKKKHKTNIVQKSIKKAEHIHNDEKILKTNIVEESVNFATKIKELESKISVIETQNQQILDLKKQNKERELKDQENQYKIKELTEELQRIKQEKSEQKKIEEVEEKV